MKKEDKWNGICISGAFIFILGFLYLNPDYLGNRVVNGMISTLSGIIGIVGLTVELSKLMKKIDGLIDLGSGCFFIVIWQVIYDNWNYAFLNFLILFFLFFGVYGILNGVAKIIESIRSSSAAFSFKSIGIMTANLAVFLLTVLQIVQIVLPPS